MNVIVSKEKSKLFKMELNRKTLILEDLKDRRQNQQPQVLKRLKGIHNYSDDKRKNTFKQLNTIKFMVSIMNLIVLNSNQELI